MRRITACLPFLCLMFCLVAFPTGTFANTITISYGQCATCGPTGGPALQVLLQGLNVGDTAALALVDTAASYNPATITSIDASVDKNATFSQTTPFTGTFGNGFRPVVEQNGILYLLSPSIAGGVFGSNTTASTSFTSGWTTISQSGLTLSNFVQYSFTTGTFGTGTPNLTDRVEFGLAAISGPLANTQISNGTAENDFANLSISDGPLLADTNFSDLANYQPFSYPVPAIPTPEPSTLSLLGIGLVGLYCRARNKFSK
jgi:PEP-CTERM motif